MYESKREPILPNRDFMRRLAGHFLASCCVIGGSLFLGMAGYHHYEHLSWLDSFLNAAMLLGGLGPIETPRTHGGKLFAGIYALYSGLVFLIVMGVMLAPVLHRVLHRFHWEDPTES